MGRVRCKYVDVLPSGRSASVLAKGQVDATGLRCDARNTSGAQAGTLHQRRAQLQGFQGFDRSGLSGFAVLTRNARERAREGLDTCIRKTKDA
jgi:hypothetical protein